MSFRKTRFAPSPTGLIHIGNVRTALLSKLYGQRFLLRIEDTDQERSRAEFVEALMEDLQWLGLDWDEGPRSATAQPEYHQSQRGGLYDEYYLRLVEENLAYPCFCSATELEVARKVQLAAGQPPRYSGKCGRLTPDDIAAKYAQGLKPTLRFRVHKDTVVEFDDLVRGPQRFASNDIGDFIIRRADGSAAFFFCNAIDDSLMGVTHVLRGDDHLSNTPRQIMILCALGLPLPSYGHTALILGDDGAPLSKRNGSRSIRELREEGYIPIAVTNMLARLGHHYDSEALLDIQALSSGFRVEHLGKSPARFDPIHLNHWQELAVRAAGDEALWDWLHPDSRVLIPELRRTAFLDIVRSNCRFPAEAHHWAAVLFSDALERSADVQNIANSAGETFFRAAYDAAAAHPDSYEAFLDYLKQHGGTKGKGLFQPLRAALTGQLDGPELPKIYSIMESRRWRMRLAEFIQSAE